MSRKIAWTENDTSRERTCFSLYFQFPNIAWHLVGLNKYLVTDLKNFGDVVGETILF